MNKGRRAGLAAVLLACALVGAGCGGNAGGKTSCNDYLQMSLQGRTGAVKSMLSGLNQPTDQDDVMESVVSASAYCGLEGGSGATIDGIFKG